MYFIEFEKLSKQTPSEWKNSDIGIKAQNIFRKLYENDYNKDYFTPRTSVQITESYVHLMTNNMNTVVVSNDTAPLNTRKYENFSFAINKNHSKFPTSKIYGFREKLESSPNILLSKEDFKSTYKADLIPEYNYNIALDFLTSFKYNEQAKHRQIFNEKIKPIADYCIEEILEVFKQYGELELSPPRKNSKVINYLIKNSINFILEIAQKEEFKIDKNGELVPNLKLEVRLQESTIFEKEVKDENGNMVTKKFNQRYIKSTGYKNFTVEIRNFDFLPNPAYYAISMTPHGYLRLKKDYSKEFFKKIIFHYQFKKYFEKYEIEMELNELEDNPQAFFDLVAMMNF
jgi:hypothetical protein